MIRVGIVGAGFMGRNHFNQYEKLGSRCKVVALCDKEADRRAGDWSNVGGNVGDKQGSQRDLTGIKPYTEWRDLIADPNIDMLDICVPTPAHKEISIGALQAGKHVLCEKPMSLNLADCDAMLAAAKASRGKFMIAQVIRFWAEYRYLKHVHDEKTFGKLQALHLRRQAATPDYSLGNWLLNPELSGGAVLDLHVHDVDFVLGLLGKPKSVFAGGYVSERGVNRVHAAWDYGDNRAIQIEGFWDMPTAYPFSMGYTAVFEKASLDWDLASGKPLSLLRAGEKEAQTPETPTEDGYFAEIEYFVGCVERNENPRISTPQESRDAVALALAEKQSIVEHRVIGIS